MEPVGTTLTALKAVKTFYDAASYARNRFLMKKIEAFGADPQNETSKEFLCSLSLEKFEELQDILMHSLNSAETVVKAMYLRKLMNALCEKRITWLQFGKMNFILNQIYTFDLVKLVKFYHGNKSEIGENDKERFFTLGLLNHKTNLFGGNDTVTKKDLKKLEIEYECNDLGQLFIDCILFEEKNRITQQYAEETKKNWNNYSKLITSLINNKLNKG